MNRVVSGAILFLVLLSAGFGYLGLSKFLLAAVLCGLWLALSVILSFVSDRRYTRAFGVDQTSQLSTGAPRLSIGRAILVGELVVNVPVISLLVGVIVIAASLLQHAVGYNGVGHAPASLP